MNDMQETDRALRELFRRNAASFDSRQALAGITRRARAASATRHRRTRHVTAIFGVAVVIASLSVLGYFALGLMAKGPATHSTSGLSGPVEAEGGELSCE